MYGSLGWYMVEIIAQGIIPLIVFLVVLAGTLSDRKSYEHFTKGAVKGLKITADLVPTLIGLLVGVGALRASGILDAFCGWLGSFTEKIGIPPSVVPVAVVKIFSSSAATGLMLDIFKTNGVDSAAGQLAALILSSTETLMYTVSIYYMAVKITKTRWTIPGALFSMLAGVIASTVFVAMM